MREIDRRRHERALLVDLALGAGVTEHHALVARAFLFGGFGVLLGVDAHGDVRRLAVQQHLDIGAVEREAVLIVADILDDLPRRLRDHLAIDDGLVAVLVKQRSLAAALAGDDDLIRRAQRLAAESRIDLAVVGDSELDVVFEKQIEDRVRDLVANLVRVSFRHQLAGEQIV